ncbi:hypothetical protein BDW59DRAFT_158262 [Aspergillus cavernicola]|uniref:FAD/NAD(P)-binding domain-containing protein n=1 Tax=Aspergillus cavernicola TaxID=176166 RepID=A0ABR4ITA8_9EURO
MSSPRDFHVLILGGGNCGLAIATGLKKADIKYSVFDRDDQETFYNHSRGWGMLLHWDSEYLERRLPAFRQSLRSFIDGTTPIGDMAIGCDGSRFKVREFLFGHHQVQLELVDLTVINYPKSGYTPDEARLLRTLHPVFKLAAHPMLACMCFFPLDA